ncbi:MAG: DUF1800 family protein [Candidatus Binatia bacterium]
MMLPSSHEAPYDSLKLASKSTSRWFAPFLSAFLIIGSLVSIANADSIPADLREIHVLNRLGFGPRAGDIERVQSVGVERYIDEQLSPSNISLPESLNTRLKSCLSP